MLSHLELWSAPVRPFLECNWSPKLCMEPPTCPALHRPLALGQLGRKSLMGWGGPAGRLLVTQGWEWWRCQRDVAGMEKRSERNLMTFNEEKCQVLPLGRNTPMKQWPPGWEAPRQKRTPG